VRSSAVEVGHQRNRPSDISFWQSQNPWSLYTSTLIGDAKFDLLYCPLLAAEIRSKERCYRMLNWGLVPQIKTVHRSPLLYYTQVRDAGDGII